VCWRGGIDFTLAVLILLMSSAEVNELQPTDFGNRPSSYLCVVVGKLVTGPCHIYVGVGKLVIGPCHIYVGVGKLVIGPCHIYVGVGKLVTGPCHICLFGLVIW
jgi:hypothetical protein